MIRIVNLSLIILFAVLLTSFTVAAKEKGLELTGSCIKALLVCYDDFKQIDSMSYEQRVLDNYKIKISENKKEYLIEYIPKLLSESEMKKINRMTIGRNIKYVVNKNTTKITKREFYK
ncbi:MAG: hypothetical protein A2X82_15480 [Geobacteraceae bacterium GWC2_55_20]|nr:MAG: hypothetical protein A2X82_15480 [Geobacteraceae bacterium GWC2_55_20]OGU22339.1 MAG: hypothetical protein A2X85_13540 [Geobacteraceae bacterium GWF2_54_21]HCE68181.1 hypothetical protein [Geobacter sp.]